MKKFQSRQGDIFFKTVQKPKNLTEMKPHKSRILAFGEVTGHSHQIKEGPEVQSFVDSKGDIYMFSKSETIVGHDEHSDIKLPAGSWICVTRQREYDPLAAEQERKVAD
jgi:hypothetical protein